MNNILITYKVGRQKSIPQTSTRVWKKLSSTTSWSLHPRTQRLKFQKSTQACAFCFCLSVSPLFASDTSPKWIDREGLGKRLTGTRHPVRSRVDSFDRRVTCEKRKSLVFSGLFLQNKVGEIHRDFVGALIKQSFHSHLLDMRWL